jgi:hypothetical protein
MLKIAFAAVRLRVSVKKHSTRVEAVEETAKGTRATVTRRRRPELAPEGFAHAAQPQQLAGGGRRQVDDVNEEWGWEAVQLLRQ